MIVYDNASQFAILFQKRGSVIPAGLPLATVACLIGAFLSVSRHLGWTKDEYQDSYLKDPFALQTFAAVTGFLLVVRTNMALSRWMEGIGDVQVMLSKWSDAFNQLNAFFAGKQDSEDKRILMFRMRIAHWFSLMSCLAFATLRGGGVPSIEDVAIKELNEEVHEAKGKLKKSKSFASMRDNDTELGQDSQSPSGSGNRLSEELRPKTVQQTVIPSKTALVRQTDLAVISMPTPEEVELLDVSNDKVNLVCFWIIQGIILEVRAKTLDAPPPIVTRVLQELSSGMLGFNQAHKVAMVPFPFPFAQMVSLLLVCLIAIMPFYVDNFTRHVVMTPMICFIVPLIYQGLNQIAIELEEPFGMDDNDVDIEVRHEEFLWMLVDVCRQHTTPPVDETTEKPSEIIRRGVNRGLQEVLDQVSSPFTIDMLNLATEPPLRPSDAARWTEDAEVAPKEEWLEESNKEEEGEDGRNL